MTGDQLTMDLQPQTPYLECRDTGDGVQQAIVIGGVRIPYGTLDKKTNPDWQRIFSTLPVYLSTQRGMWTIQRVVWTR